MTRRPQEGDQVTLLFQQGDRPVTRVTHVRQVARTGVVLAREGQGLDGAPEGTEVAVLFVHGERLYRWPMRLQESLPSSVCLASVKEPGEGERREFVRADAHLCLRLTPVTGGQVSTLQGKVDLSASGFRVDAELDLPADTELDVEIRRQPDDPPVRGRARVVRADPGADRKALACEFVQMGSADESRLVELIFDVRAHALRRRITGA